MHIQLIVEFCIVTKSDIYYYESIRKCDDNLIYIFFFYFSSLITITAPLYSHQFKINKNQQINFDIYIYL
jgi:hypothetical protein